MSRCAVLSRVFAWSLLACSVAAAVESPPAPQPAVHDVLAAEQAGLAEVRYIPNDSRSAQIVVANRSDRPLAFRLPHAFAGVPVLAQFGAGAGAGNRAGGGAQATGGGMGMGGMGMGGMGMGGMGMCWVAREVYGPLDPRWVEFRLWMTVDAPRWLRDGYAAHGEAVADWIHDRPAARRLLRVGMDSVIDDVGSGGGQFRVAVPAEDGSFVVPPGKQRTFRFATVCLEYGKPEPSARMPYKLVTLESFSSDPRLPVVMAALAGGHVSQKTAQAAAWHIASGLSWERLAAEMIDRVGGVPDDPYFAPVELEAAHRLVVEAERLTSPERYQSSTAE